jgi:hypothetical protein
MKGGFVTESVGTISRRECNHCETPFSQPSTGRPKKFCSDACKMAAYREKAFAVVVGAPVWHPKHEAGIVVSIHGDRAYCAFRRGDGRIWADLNVAEGRVAVIGKPRKLPAWTSPRQRDRKPRQNRRADFRDIHNSIFYASVGGERPDHVPTYRRTRWGASRKFKDYTYVINDRLAHLVDRAKNNKEQYL